MNTTRMLPVPGEGGKAKHFRETQLQVLRGLAVFRVQVPRILRVLAVVRGFFSADTSGLAVFRGLSLRILLVLEVLRGYVLRVLQVLV